MSGPSHVRERDRDVRTGISEAVAGLQREFYGRGPDEIRTYYVDDLVVCILRGGFTRVERTLIDGGRLIAVLEQRRQFQMVMHDRYRAVVEHATGRPVIAFVSGNQLDPDLMSETFVLAPRGPGGSPA